MTSYHIIWEIDVQADSPEEAAYKALAMQRNPESTATVFDVYRWDETEPTRIDLEISPHANAQSIAAEPDLLAALETLVDHAQEKYPHFESERGQRDIAAALKAIARARG
jgi:hypothetical protein